MNCAFCGKEFNPDWARNPSSVKYCSKNCRGLYGYYQGPKPLSRRILSITTPRNCLECGKEFTPDSRHASAQRCSAECNSLHQKSVLSTNRKKLLGEKLSVPRICIVCGKEYIPYHWQQAFCSSVCRTQGGKERAKRYADTLPKEVRSARHRKCRLDGNWQKAMERDNFRCQMCGTMEKSMVHHLDGEGEKKYGVRQKNNTELSNLMVLCDQCHKDIHGIFLVKQDGEWRIKGKVFERLGLNGSIKMYK